MKRPLLSLLFSAAIVFASPAMACMNDYVPNTAAIERSKSVLEQLQKHAEAEPWDARRDRLRKELATGGDYKVKNDLAVALSHTGEAAEAVTLLEQIEAEKPGLYVTAANLGTAYELRGNDEKALEWIRKGISLNADAHKGTEWLHVRILEAKLGLRADPTWLQLNSVLGPRKQNANNEFVGPAEIRSLSLIGNRGEKLSRFQIENALLYQLHERLQFVNPPDAIVGDLLLELGHLLSQHSPGSGGAKDVYQLAGTFLKKLDNVESLQEDASAQWVRAYRSQLYGSKKTVVLINLVRGFAGTIAGVCLLILVIRLMRWTRQKQLTKSPKET